MSVKSRKREEMGEIYRSILKMGAYVEEALGKALHALMKRNLPLAQDVVRDDHMIDRYRDQIEDLCAKRLANKGQDPESIREVIAIIKVASDLERIGDYARHLAKAISSVRESLLERVLPLLREMTETGIRMVNQALAALSELDSAKASAAAEEDHKMDSLYKDLKALLIKIMKEDPEFIEEAAKLLMLNRFLERLGDHVTNICEWVVYANHGSRVQLN